MRLCGGRDLVGLVTRDYVSALVRVATVVQGDRDAYLSQTSMTPEKRKAAVPPADLQELFDGINGKEFFCLP